MWRPCLTPDSTAYGGFTYSRSRSTRSPADSPRDQAAWILRTTSTFCSGIAWPVSRAAGSRPGAPRASPRSDSRAGFRLVVEHLPARHHAVADREHEDHDVLHRHAAALPAPALDRRREHELALFGRAHHL